MANGPITVGYGLPAFFTTIANLMHADADQILHSFRSGLDTVALAYQGKWRNYAQGAPIPDTTRRIHSTGPYTRSIQVDLQRPFEKRIYTDYRWASVIENGHGEIDLKEGGGRGLLHGPKARLSKRRVIKGEVNLPHAYNVVSFRHGTPRTSSNPMSQDIYATVQKMMTQAKEKNREVASVVVQKGGGRFVTHPDSGHVRQLDTYRWNLRTGELGRRKTSKTGYKWKSGKQSSMVYMKGGQYRTFRTVSTKSDPRSWIVPPLEGIPIRQIVVDEMRRTGAAERILADTLLQDLAMGGAQDQKT